MYNKIQWPNVGRRVVGGELGRRKYGRITHKLSWGEQLGILEEGEKEEEGEEEEREKEKKEGEVGPLERQDSGLSTISSFSEVDFV